MGIAVIDMLPLAKDICSFLNQVSPSAGAPSDHVQTGSVSRLSGAQKSSASCSV
jgi:hypothetical protein